MVDVHDHLMSALAALAALDRERPRSPGSASDFGKFKADEIHEWAKVVKFSGAKPD
jgi:hypothetical protein